MSHSEPKVIHGLGGRAFAAHPHFSEACGWGAVLLEAAGAVLGPDPFAPVTRGEWLSPEAAEALGNRLLDAVAEVRRKERGR